jgi:hypothetical protein
MSQYKLIAPAQLNSTVQVMLDYLDDPQNLTPNNMVEAMAAGKSILRGILAGRLAVCQVSADPDQDAAPHENE